MNCNGANGGRSSSLSLSTLLPTGSVFIVVCVRSTGSVNGARRRYLAAIAEKFGEENVFFFQVPSPPDVIQTLDRQLRLALGRWPTGRPSPCGVCRRWSSSSWQRPPTGTRCSAASYSTTSRPSRTTRTCALTRRSPTSSSTTFGERSWQR